MRGVMRMRIEGGEGGGEFQLEVVRGDGECRLEVILGGVLATATARGSGVTSEV